MGFCILTFDITSLNNPSIIMHVRMSNENVNQDIGISVDFIELVRFERDRVFPGMFVN